MDRRVTTLAGGALALLAVLGLIVFRSLATEDGTGSETAVQKGDERRVTRFSGDRTDATPGAERTPSQRPHDDGEATSGAGDRDREASPDAAVDAPDAPEALPDLGVELSAWPISKEGIQGAVQEVSPAVKDCYDANLEAVADLAGRLVVSFTVTEVDGIGKVTAVDAPESTVNDGPLEDCVLEVMQALQFDAPDDPTNVSYPFVFSTE